MAEPRHLAPWLPVVLTRFRDEVLVRSQNRVRPDAGRTAELELEVSSGAAVGGAAFRPFCAGQVLQPDIPAPSGRDRLGWGDDPVAVPCHFPAACERLAGPILTADVAGEVHRGGCNNRDPRRGEDTHSIAAPGLRDLEDLSAWMLQIDERECELLGRNVGLGRSEER